MLTNTHRPPALTATHNPATPPNAAIATPPTTPNHHLRQAFRLPAATAPRPIDRNLSTPTSAPPDTDCPIYQSPVLFGTRNRTTPPHADVTAPPAQPDHSQQQASPLPTVPPETARPDPSTAGKPTTPPTTSHYQPWQGFVPTAGIDPCPTLLGLRALRNGGPPW